MSKAQYKSQTPTIPDGQMIDLQVDVNGNLKTTVSGGVSATTEGTYNATPPTLVDGTLASLQLDSKGNLKTVGAGSTTATLSNVASSATSVTILAANANRKGASFFNDSTAILYLALTSSAASTTNYTVQIPAGAYYELEPAAYTGQLTGIWASANGNARVTELS